MVLKYFLVTKVEYYENGEIKKGNIHCGIIKIRAQVVNLPTGNAATTKGQDQNFDKSQHMYQMLPRVHPLVDSNNILGQKTDRGCLSP